METYSYTTYPDSGDSSPHSRDTDFDNLPPWDDHHHNNHHYHPLPPSTNHKVKLMCSYNGKIQPRPHDNKLAYAGGVTKILAVDRNVKFSHIDSKLSAFCDGDEICFKYQLPGEDLDNLISVTNDEDLEHMMHEYDRIYRASNKPVRLRLFLFPVRIGSGDVKSDPIRTVDVDSVASEKVKVKNVDYLFGLEKGETDLIPGKAVQVEPPAAGSEVDDRVYCSDPILAPVEIQKQIQDLQNIQIPEQEQTMRRITSSDNITGGYAGDYYAARNFPEKLHPAPVTVSVPSVYWQEKSAGGGGYTTSMTTSPGAEPPVYMIQAPGSMYHAAAMVRPGTGQGGQAYYTFQRFPTEIYREAPVYNQAQLPPLPQSAFQATAQSMTAYSDTGYAQVAYDSGGRQVYYPAPGSVVPQYTAVTAVSADMRPSGPLHTEGNGVTNELSS